MLSFYKSLSDVEEAVSRMRWNDDLDDRLRLMFGDSPLLDLLDLTEGDDGYVRTERRRDEILLHDQMLGRELIITNTDYSLKEIIEMSLYAHRYDQDLSIFRTDLQGGATLFPSNEAAIASLMGDFFSHIMKLSLIRRLSDSELADEVNYLDAISIVSSIKGCWIDGKFTITNLSPDQERVFRGLGMDVPDVGSFLMRRVRGSGRLRPEDFLQLTEDDVGRPGYFSRVRAPGADHPAGAEQQHGYLRVVHPINEPGELLRFVFRSVSPQIQKQIRKIQRGSRIPGGDHVVYSGFRIFRRNDACRLKIPQDCGPG